MKTALVTLLSFISLVSFSQKKEWLVKQNGDTLFGEIHIKNKEFVISTSTNNTVILKATDVKSVQMNKHAGNIVLPCVLHTYTDNLEELEKYYYFGKELDTVLILSEVYSTPKMNLYWSQDAIKTQYYFYKTPTDSLPIQLYVNYSLGERNNFGLAQTKGQTGIHLVVQKGYVNQLRFIMGDCKKISEEEWAMLDYRIYSFKSLIKRYNKCK